MSGLYVNIGAMVICSVMLLLLFWFNMAYWRPKYINTVSISYMLVFFNCYMEIAAFWADGKIQYIWLNWLANGLYLSAINLLSLSYAHYCSSVLPKPLWKNKRQHVLFVIPAAVEILLILTSYWTDLIYTVDANGYYHRSYGFILQFLPYVYILALSVLGLIKWKQAQSVREKRIYSSIALFVVPPFVLGIVQLMVKANGFATLEFGLLMSLMIMYHVEQDSRITRDPLTRLPNRLLLDSILEEGIKEARREYGKPLYVMLGDLDNFKSINDTFGHMEGDRALVLTADVLYETAGANGATAARFGGDEFVVVVNTEIGTLPDMIRRQVNAKLEEISKETPFKLEMSFGCAQFRVTDSYADILKAADKALYMAKAQRKSGKK